MGAEHLVTFVPLVHRCVRLLGGQMLPVADSSVTAHGRGGLADLASCQRVQRVVTIVLLLVLPIIAGS